MVEDAPGVIRLLHEYLDDKCAVSVAATSREGIELARHRVPDLIITGLAMQAADGMTLCQALKQDLGTCHIPIILLGTKLDKASRIKSLEQGADAYVAWPYDLRELLAHARQLMELRKELKEKYTAMALGGISGSVSARPDMAFMAKLMEVLKACAHDEDFHPGDLATRMGMGRVQLFRKLKALTGQSASDLVQSFRLRKAKFLLGYTDLRISEIAFAVGYKDPAYFSRMFAREFGEAPSAMRREDKAAVRYEGKNRPGK